MQGIDMELFGRFDDVWQRVQGSTALPRESEWMQTEELMEQLYGLWRGYKKLETYATGSNKCILSTLAMETRQRFQKLQLGYFLDTGDVYSPECDPDFAISPLSDLRKMWKNASFMTEKLQNCMEQGGRNTDSEYKETVEMLKKHRIMLEQVIASILQ